MMPTMIKILLNTNKDHSVQVLEWYHCLCYNLVLDTEFLV